MYQADNLVLPQLSDTDFAKLKRLMQQVSGITMAPHKKQLVAGRLLKRLKALELATFSDYVAVLDDPAQQEERRLAVDLLTTNETYFFRDEAHFTLLRRMLGEWRKADLSIWSAACSSGEEVYSLSMLLNACLPGHISWHLVGSDLCRPVLQQAEQGIYPLSRAKGIPHEWLQRYCLRGVGEMEGMLSIKPQLRQRVRFCCINLNEALPGDLPYFDLVFLRNILIYFDRDAKVSLIRRVLTRLQPGGLLFVGHSESLLGLNLPLVPVAAAVYRHEPK